MISYNTMESHEFNNIYFPVKRNIIQLIDCFHGID